MPLCKSKQDPSGGSSDRTATEIESRDTSEKENECQRGPDVESPATSSQASLEALSLNTSACDDADDDITRTDSGASSWLETLGLDRNKYRSLDPDKVKM